MNKPLVSIACITYNHEKYIAEAIDSFLMQETDFDFEIVIGEDCSTDETLEIVKGYKAKFPEKILIITSNNNVGMMPNLIRTLEACKGQYIALCDGDDYWIDELKLQKQIELLEQSKEISLTYSYQFTLKGDKLNTNPNTRKGIQTQVDVINGFIPPTRTVVFRNIDGLCSFLNDNVTQPSGDKFISYYMSKYGNLKCIEEHMAVYRITDFGVWTSIDAKEQVVISLTYYFEFLKIIEKSTIKASFYKRLLKFINDISGWFSPKVAFQVYFMGIKSLFDKRLYIQTIILLFLSFYFVFITAYSFLFHQLNKYKSIKLL